MLRSLCCIIISLFCLTTALSFFAGLSISQYAKTFSDTPSDAAIVLGASKVAKNYAIAKGVKTSNILIETRSKITFENLEEAKKLLDEKQLETVLIVSDPLHMKLSLIHILTLPTTPYV